MKKVIGIIVVVVILGVGGYALAKHNDNKTSGSTSSYSSSPSPKTSSSTSSQPSTPAVNNAVLTTKTDSSVGSYLADVNGNALYTYSADSSGVSNCSGYCLNNWPIYEDTGATTSLPANVGTIKRDDGKTQYTYKGLPLYTFTGDSKGKATGDGVDGFKIAKP